MEGNRNDFRKNLLEDSDSQPTYTVDDAIDKIAERGGLHQMQWKLFLILSLVLSYHSFIFAWLPLLVGFARCSFGIPEWQAMLLAPVWQIGRTLASLWTGTLGDHFGRKVALAMSMASSFYFIFLATFAPSYTWQMILHFLSGCGAGSSLAQTYTYGAELFPSQKRHVLLTSLQFWFSATGVLYIGLQLVLFKFNVAWQLGATITAVPALLAAILSAFIVESPHFFIARRQPQKAFEVLLKIAGGDRARLPPGRLISTQKTQQLTKKLHGKYWLLVLFRPMSRCLVTSLLCISAFLTFILAHGYYYLAATLLDTYPDSSGSVARTTERALRCPPFKTRNFMDMMVGIAAEALSIVLALVEVKYMRQRISFFLNGALSALSFGCLLIPGITRATATGIFFIGRVFPSVNYAVVGIYAPEFFPSAVRAKAVSFIMAFGLFGSVIAPFACEYLVVISPTAAKLVFLGIAVLLCISSSLLPNTAGRKLEDGV